MRIVVLAARPRHTCVARRSASCGSSSWPARRATRPTRSAAVGTSVRRAFGPLHAGRRRGQRGTQRARRAALPSDLHSSLLFRPSASWSPAAALPSRSFTLMGRGRLATTSVSRRDARSGVLRRTRCASGARCVLARRPRQRPGSSLVHRARRALSLSLCTRPTSSWPFSAERRPNAAWLCDLEAEDAREPGLLGKRAILATSTTLGDGHIGEHRLDVAAAAGVARTTTRGAIDAAAHEARRIPDPCRACKSDEGEVPAHDHRGVALISTSRASVGVVPMFSPR